jgi:modulator of FtsH protease
MTMDTQTLRPASHAVALPTQAGAELAHDSARVLSNTHALLSLTLLWSAATATASVVYALPAPGLIISLVAMFGLLFAIHKLQNSAWSLAAVFALTGFMGYSLGPLLGKMMSLPGGSQSIALALGSTGATFVAMSIWGKVSRRDFSFMGGMLMAGMVVALVLSLAAIFLEMPALSLAVSALVALLSAGMILFETQQIVQGGQRNYVLATVSLYVSLFNLFTSLLSLFGIGGLGNSDD